MQILYWFKYIKIYLFILYMSKESNLDLDVDNYSINDLKKFFKLSDDETPANMKKKIDEISNKLLFSDNLKYDNSTKKEIFAFVNKAKDLIITHQSKKITNMVSKEPHFVQAINSYPENHVNQAEFNYKTKLLVLNSIYSDTGLSSSTINSYTFTLPETIKNVVGLTLAALQYPNVELAFSDYKGNNLMFLQENYTNTPDINSNPTTSEEDGKSATIRLPSGTYSVENFPAALQKNINLALGYPINGTDGPTTSIFTLPRYYVSINPNSQQTTITNNLDPENTFYPEALAYSKTFNGNNNFFANFTMVFDKPTWTSNSSSICVPGSQNNPPDPNFKTLMEGYENNNLQYRSLGYQMGFRNIVNSGKISYTSVSIYNSNIINYVYFALEDYITTRVDEVNGIFFNSIFDKNILALVPITSQPFSSNLDSGANFIFKTRNYSGPVNLQKVSVTFYNPNGFVTQLNGTPFAFALELKIAYENPAVKDWSTKGLDVGFSEQSI